MACNLYTLSYKDADVAPSRILLYRSVPDIAALYDIKEIPAGGQIFVTDTEVSALPAMTGFISQFKDIRAGHTGTGIRISDAQDGGRSVLVVLPAGEAYKTAENVLFITETALRFNIQRSGVFIGVGGGVITDMAAFAASIYRRGAQLELVPTTLLAMADAAVGGKTGCDFAGCKNMIGSFYPAHRIHIMPDFVQSLPDAEYRSGLAEAVKTALLYDKDLYRILSEQYKQVLDRNPALIEEIAQRCVMAKAAVVEEDLTEKGRRMQLNFGHTFGHALETTAGLGVVSHGDAVAWGMARAVQTGYAMGLCSAAYRDEITELLLRYGWSVQPVPPALSGMQNKQAAALLLEAMRKDKKNSGSKIRLILQKGLTDTVITEVPETTILSVLS